MTQFETHAFETFIWLAIEHYRFKYSLPVEERPRENARTHRLLNWEATIVGWTSADGRQSRKSLRVYMRLFALPGKMTKDLQTNKREEGK